MNCWNLDKNKSVWDHTTQPSDSISFIQWSQPLVSFISGGGCSVMDTRVNIHGNFSRVFDKVDISRELKTCRLSENMISLVKSDKIEIFDISYSKTPIFQLEDPKSIECFQLDWNKRRGVVGFENSLSIYDFTSSHPLSASTNENLWKIHCIETDSQKIVCGAHQTITVLDWNGKSISNWMSASPVCDLQFDESLLISCGYHVQVFDWHL